MRTVEQVTNEAKAVILGKDNEIAKLNLEIKTACNELDSLIKDQLKTLRYVKSLERKYQKLHNHSIKLIELNKSLNRTIENLEDSNKTLHKKLT